MSEGLLGSTIRFSNGECANLFCVIPGASKYAHLSTAVQGHRTDPPVCVAPEQLSRPSQFPQLLCFPISGIRYNTPSHGAVAKWLRQRIANPPSSVRIRSAPLEGLAIGRKSFSMRKPLDCMARAADYSAGTRETKRSRDLLPLCGRGSCRKGRASSRNEVEL